MARVTVSSKGQIVLPKHLRDELSIREGDLLSVHREYDRLVLERCDAPNSARDWRSWRGSIAGSGALEEHVREHAEEVARDRLP